MKRRFALALLLALAGCGRPPMTPDRAIASLRAPDAETRRQAADDLRRDEANGVPADAVPALLDALSSEPEPAVRGSILLTLGRSGAPEAKPAIDDAIATETDPHLIRSAKRARKYWLVQNDSSDQSWAYWVPGWQPPGKIGPN
jgi:HEAT repeats